MPEMPVIIITGASSGIGEATARYFGQKGYRVVVAARRFDRLAQLAQEIQEAGGQALPIQADLAVVDDIRKMVERVIAEYGQIDVLFNNAGMGRLDWLENLDLEKDVYGQLNVNLLGLIATTHAVLPHMIYRRRGQIINMASVASFIATPTYSIYAASKFGVRGFSESLRREVGVWGIHVSVMYPGGVVTEFGKQARLSRKQRATTPSRLRLTPEQVAQGVYSLVKHPRATYVLPWLWRIPIWANLLFPALVDWVIRERFTRKERNVSQK